MSEAWKHIQEDLWPPPWRVHHWRDVSRLWRAMILSQAWGGLVLVLVWALGGGPWLALAGFAVGMFVVTMYQFNRNYGERWRWRK